VHFPQRTIPIAIGLTVAAYLLHRPLPIAPVARGLVLLAAVLALVLVGPVGVRGASAAPVFAGQPISGTAAAALDGATKTAADARAWQLAEWHGIPFALVRAHRSDFFFSGENSPRASVSLRSLGAGFSSAHLANVCDNSVITPCWAQRDQYGARDWSGLEIWRRGGELVYVTIGSRTGDDLGPFGIYTVRPRVDLMGAALWIGLALLLCRGPVARLRVRAA
jgi:hypothetical protein